MSVYIGGLLFLLFITNALKGILSKRCLRFTSPKVLLFSSAIAAFSFACAIYLTTTQEDIIITPTLTIVFLLSGTLYYIGKLYNFKARQADELSYLAPLKGLTTIAVIVVAFLVLNESPNIWGIVGTILIILGIFLVVLEKNNRTVTETCIALSKRKGLRYFSVTVVCYGITTVLDKVGVVESSPIIWMLGMSSFLIFSSILASRNNPKELFDRRVLTEKVMLAFLFLSVIEQVIYFTVIEITLATYVSLSRSMSVLLVVLLSGYLLSEKNIARRFVATGIVVVGVGLIIFHS